MTMFRRMMLACLIPLVVIFAAVIATINNVVREQMVTYAGEMSETFASGVSKHINDGFTNVHALVGVVAEYAANIDASDPDAEEEIVSWIKSILRATPYVYNIWVSYEPGGFFEDARFSRDVVNRGDTLIVIHDLDDDLLDDPEEAPWYYFPFKTGVTWFESVDWYDYGLGDGAQYTGTVSAPIVRGGVNIGVVGVDMLYKNIFRFIETREIPDVQTLFVVSQDGEILFATDSAHMKTSLFDWPLARSEFVKEQLAQNEPFSVSGVSPFTGRPSWMFFHPLSDLSERSTQLYLCVDMTADAMFREADSVTYAMMTIGVYGLAILTAVIYFSLKSAFKPVREVTKAANLIASGHLNDAAFNLILEKNIDSQKRRSKDEMSNLFFAFRSMRETRMLSEKYKAMSEAKTNFLAKMSHEIRTPMNAIIGMAELAMREDLPKAAKEQVLTIKHAGANLLSIINDILDISKIESGNIDIVNADYQFSSLVNDVVSIIRMKTVDTVLRFTVNVDRKIPNVFCGDEVRIRQVLLNILSNAVKYTDAGTVSFVVRGETVDLKRYLLKIEVADTGKGIRSEDMEHLFSEFTQFDIEKNRWIEGTGLGLAITKNLVTAMGGEIDVASTYGEGSTFTVTLPQIIRSHQPLATVVRPEEKGVVVYERREAYKKSISETLDNLGVACACVQTEEDLVERFGEGRYSFIFIERTLYESVRDTIAKLKPKPQIVIILTTFDSADAEYGHDVIYMPVYSIPVANILNGVTDSYVCDSDEPSVARFRAPDARVLIVDDIKTNLEVAKGLLAPYEMQIDTCLSGADAVQMTRDNHYDLVLMDHMMPGMDGIEATRRIRGQCHPDLVVVALTANAVCGARELFLENGFNDFLAKPIDTTKLAHIIERRIPKSLRAYFSRARTPAADTDAADVAAGINIRGVSANLGMSRTGGRLATYLRTLEMFHDDSFEKIAQIEGALADDDLSLYAIYVHALKGASANVGAVDLAESAYALEVAANRGDKNFLLVNTPVVLGELKAIISDVELVLAERKGAQNAVDIDISSLKPLLASLKTAIGDIDPAAMNAIVKSLEPFERAQEVGASIKKITLCVLNGEYDDAVPLIDDLLM